MSWVGRCLRAGAVLAALAAAVPMAWWAVPASHRPPRTTVYWPADANVDGGRWLSYRIVRQGLDVAGYVFQERDLTVQAPRGNLLDPVRHRPDVSLQPVRRGALLFTSYGINHAYRRDGVSTSDAGLVCTVPYSLMAATLVSPTGAWLAWTAFGLVRRRPSVVRLGRLALGPGLPPAVDP